MAARMGFSVLGSDVDLDERAGRKKNDKINKPKSDETGKKSSGNNKLPNKKKKPAAATTESVSVFLIVLL